MAFPLVLPNRFDLAICTEVAEHVKRESAAILVESLAQAADVIAFGAAIPMQGGHGHINEQWPSYWRALFAKSGYQAYDIVRPVHWSDREIHYWYRQNMFVYVKDTNTVAVSIAKELSNCPSEALFDAVLPEKFEEVASYESISFGRLMRRLPSWVSMRVQSKLLGKG